MKARTDKKTKTEGTNERINMEQYDTQYALPTAAQTRSVNHRL
jgi:hypothetical protein